MTNRRALPIVQAPFVVVSATVAARLSPVLTRWRRDAVRDGLRLPAEVHDVIDACDLMRRTVAAGATGGARLFRGNDSHVSEGPSESGNDSHEEDVTSSGNDSHETAESAESGNDSHERELGSSVVAANGTPKASDDAASLPSSNVSRGSGAASRAVAPLTTNDVAARLALQPRRVRQLAAVGLLPAVRLEGRWLIQPDDLAVFEAERKEA